jgi:hypothetical protein
MRRLRRRRVADDQIWRCIASSSTRLSASQMPKEWPQGGKASRLKAQAIMPKVVIGF